MVALGASRLLRAFECRRWLLALAVVVAATSVVFSARPARADHTQILLSPFDKLPYPTNVILFPNGPAVDLHVWTVGVDAPAGASGFEVDFDYPAALLSVTSLTAETAWLASSGGSSSCSEASITPGHGNVSSFRSATSSRSSKGSGRP